MTTVARRNFLLFSLFLLGTSLSLPAPAQVATGTISGTVRDNSGAVVPGATVALRNVETGVGRTVTTDATGRYSAPQLGLGGYEVTATATGFQTLIRRGITLTVGQEARVDFTLQLGTVAESIVVTGEAPLVETTTATVSNAVSQEQLRELPLNGRSFTDLITLQPGTMAPANYDKTANDYSASPALSVAGARTDANNFMVDGTDIATPFSTTPGSSAGVQLGVDTIREYQVITSNAKAEYGRNVGGVINSVSRSGTNQLHGSAFEFLRNNALDARDFFTQGSTLPFRRNQFGGTLGGPLKQDKAFYFLGYEGLRQRLSAPGIYFVPSIDARRGILGTQVVPVDPRVTPFLNLYPEPNGPTLGEGIAILNKIDSNPVTEDFGSARIDYNIATNDFIFGRYTIDRAVNSRAVALQSDNVWNTSYQYLTLGETHIFGASGVNAFRAGFSRFWNNDIYTEVPGSESLPETFAPGQLVGRLAVGDLSSLGGNWAFLLFMAQNNFQLEDVFSFRRGAHEIKFGARVQRFQWNSDQNRLERGSWTFSDLANFLQAGPVGTDGAVQLPGSISYRRLRSTLFAFFAQDDYHVTPSFVLNYGLRWEFTTGFTENDGLLTYMEKGPLLSTPSDLRTGKLYDNHIANFAPRLGFNWALGQDRKTSISGGFGVFYNMLLFNAYGISRQQLPFYERASVDNVDATETFPNIVALTALQGSASLNMRAFDWNNFKVPTVYRYNLTVQRELAGGMGLRVGYVGSLGRHIQREQRLNTFPQTIVRDGSLYFPPETEAPQRINPNFSVINWNSSDVNSGYNALQMSLQKRFSRGLMFQASYTWSKSIDDFSNVETIYSGLGSGGPGTGRAGQWSPDRTLDRAVSSFNVPHVFVMNGVYELPVGQGKQWLNSGGIASTVLGGWQLGGILTVQQGAPLPVGSTAPSPGYLFTATRPNLKPGTDVKGLTSGGTVERYFDTSAFSVAPPGTLGNAGRNLMIGPPLSSLNFNLNKTFRISERSSLQFRAEFFNLFNHANFANPGSRVFVSQSGRISPSAGRITETSTTPRQIQFGLKLTF